MRTKTFIFLTSMFFTFNLASFGQERINKSLPKIGTNINGQLSKATGWLLNPEKQWVSRQNRIPVYLENQFKNLIDHEKHSVGLDNFISYQLREIIIQDNSYSILIKKYKDGSYKYSTLEQDWINYTSTVFYVFNTSELEKLKNIIPDSTNLIKINILYSNSLSWIKNETYLKDIEKEVVKQMDKEKSEKEYLLVLHIAPYKTKNIVQFQIYSSYSKYNFIGGIMSELKSQVNVEYDAIGGGKVGIQNDKQIYLTNDLFKNCYFETDYTSFRNFLKIN